MKKVSIDNTAKQYWEKLYGDYGRDLVRDIPRRIKASLLVSKKIASADDNSFTVLPTAFVGGQDKLLEGVYSDSNTKLLFCAKLDNEGNVCEIDTVNIG